MAINDDVISRSQRDIGMTSARNRQEGSEMFRKETRRNLRWDPRAERDAFACKQGRHEAGLPWLLHLAVTRSSISKPTDVTHSGAYNNHLLYCIHFETSTLTDHIPNSIPCERSQHQDSLVAKYDPSTQNHANTETQDV